MMQVELAWITRRHLKLDVRVKFTRVDELKLVEQWARYFMMFSIF